MSDPIPSGPRWYAVQCLSNHEDKVCRFLARFREDDEDFSKHLSEVLVPMETVSEVKNGRKRQRDRKFYPGYVLWRCAFTTPKGICSRNLGIR